LRFKDAEMRILLANPPASGNIEYIREGRCTQKRGFWSTLWPPVTLATVAAVLLRDGHEVEVMDCAAQQISVTDFLSRLEGGTFNLAVWTTGTPSIADDLHLAESIREISPQTATAVLGTHVSVLAAECLRDHEALDYVIRGEPEETISDLARSLADGSGQASVLGISWRDRHGAVTLNPDRRFLEDLDSLPFPAWDKLDMSRYRLPLKGRPFLAVAPARGCPWNCSFCTAPIYYGHRVRKRSATSVVSEIKYIKSEYNIDDVFFWAETFTIDREHVVELCDTLIGSCTAVRWTCNSRVDTVDTELLALMARAGCWMVSYGIEAADDTVLASIGKRTTKSQARDAIRWTKLAGMRTVGHFILGFPGETLDSLQRTLDFSKELDLDFAQFYCAVPFPGTTLYKNARDNGLLVGVEWNRFRQDTAVLGSPQLPGHLVEAFCAKGYRSFYGRPRQVARLLRLANPLNVGALVESIQTWMKAISSDTRG